MRGLGCLDLEGFARSSRVAVLDIWAPSCRWCKPVSMALDRLSRRFGEQVSFGMINADECWDKVRSFGIMGLPTVLIFKNGELVDRIIGAYTAEYFEERVRRLL